MATIASTFRFAALAIIVTCGWSPVAHADTISSKLSYQDLVVGMVEADAFRAFEKMGFPLKDAQKSITGTGATRYETTLPTLSTCSVTQSIVCRKLAVDTAENPKTRQRELVGFDAIIVFDTPVKVTDLIDAAKKKYGSNAIHSWVGDDSFHDGFGTWLWTWTPNKAYPDTKIALSVHTSEANTYGELNPRAEAVARNVEIRAVDARSEADLAGTKANPEPQDGLPLKF